MSRDHPLLPLPHRHHWVYFATEDGYRYIHLNEKWCYCTQAEREICICGECMRKYNDAWDDMERQGLAP